MKKIEQKMMEPKEIIMSNFEIKIGECNICVKNIWFFNKFIVCVQQNEKKGNKND